MGLYILSAFFFIGVAGAVYLASTSPDDRVLAVVLTPCYLYAGAGLVPRWRGAREVAIVLVALGLALALMNMIALFVLDAARTLGADSVLTLVMQSGVRILILPFVLAYLLGRRVKAYYRSSG